MNFEYRHFLSGAFRAVERITQPGADILHNFHWQYVRMGHSHSQIHPKAIGSLFLLMKVRTQPKIKLYGTSPGIVMKKSN